MLQTPNNILNCPRQSARKTAGFSLVELVIVVLIMGIIATVASAKVFHVSTDAKVNSFAKQLGQFVRMAEIRNQTEGEYFKDSPTGTLPPELASYIRAEQWAAQTPINGKWDVEKNTYGTHRALGVHFISGSGTMPSSAILQQIDAIVDDGDINNGKLRLLDVDRFPDRTSEPTESPWPSPQREYSIPQTTQPSTESTPAERPARRTSPMPPEVQREFPADV